LEELMSEVIALLTKRAAVASSLGNDPNPDIHSRRPRLAQSLGSSLFALMDADVGCIAPTRASPGVVRMLMRAGALALLLQLAGCGTSDRVAQLWAYPEAELRPVGSTVLDKRERPARMTIEGRDTASVGYLLGAPEDPAAIEDFYGRELISRGWQEPTDLPAIGLRVRTSTELLARSWRKGDVVFRLGVLNPADPAAEGPSEGFASVFRIDLVDRPIDPKAN